MIFLECIGSRASLSAELTGQKWSVNGQKATNQRFVAFFIARKSCFQDFKSTVKGVSGFSWLVSFLLSV